MIKGDAFEGITGHNPEGLWFRREAQPRGFKVAVGCRDSGRAIPEADEVRARVRGLERRGGEVWAAEVPWPAYRFGERSARLLRNGADPNLVAREREYLVSTHGRSSREMEKFREQPSSGSWA